MLFGDGAGDGEAEACAAGSAVTARLAAREGFEHFGDAIVRDAGTAVFHRDDRLAAIAGQRDLGRTAVAQSVGDQVAYGALRPGEMHRGGHPFALQQHDRLAHVLEFFHDRH